MIDYPGQAKLRMPDIRTIDPNSTSTRSISLFPYTSRNQFNFPESLFARFRPSASASIRSDKEQSMQRARSLTT